MDKPHILTEEERRLRAHYDKKEPWLRWGPYVSDRQWGTVREDYSSNGNAWGYFPHDHARSRAYRWGEDGIGGVCDDKGLLNFAVALWNGKDPILKERYFGLTGPEGNHGEDVKELYYYLDNTPSHAWMQMLYKYPQKAFPYDDLVRTNARQGKLATEYELTDTGVFDANRYFDVFIDYAKAGTDDLLVRIRVVNRGPDAAPVWVLPTVWFRNTWSWHVANVPKPVIRWDGAGLRLDHHELPTMHFYADGSPEWAFCENETNAARLFGTPMEGYAKDGINNWLLHGADSINPEKQGTKASAVYFAAVGPGATAEFTVRLTHQPQAAPFAGAASVFATRKAEADAFYAHLQAHLHDTDEMAIQRQALAGVLWTKQFYYFDVAQWLEGDPHFPPDPGRKKGRNKAWNHLNTADVISMPDKWEYPWFAAWDLAFHCFPLAMVDSEFAKQQLLLFTREWYMHPNGQLPAYEWNYSDVNPPVHAWASWKVYWMEKRKTGKGDRAFLEEVFQKLLLNFTWWVNRKDHEGNNVFQGGFLGLDNIGVFDRSNELPTGGQLEQADGTSWMAMYSLNMLRISLELANENPVYQSLATKFFEHFLYIAGAMVDMGCEGISLWDSNDEFFYDILNLPDNQKIPLKVRSLVGLIPLFAVEVLDHDILEANPEFTGRLEWFLNNRKHLAALVSRWREMGKRDTHLLSIVRGHRLKALLKRMLDPQEFLSEYGIRSLSKHHERQPYTFRVHHEVFKVTYQPGESDTYMFGGNSNWRGPIWFPVNFLLIESLRRFHRYFGDDFLVEFPTRSGTYLNLNQIADELAHRLMRIFMKDEKGRRAVYAGVDRMQGDPHFSDHILFYEYFHGDTGKGLGASHQTGWTALIANLIADWGD